MDNELGGRGMRVGGGAKLVGWPSWPLPLDRSRLPDTVIGPSHWDTAPRNLVFIPVKK